MIAMLRAARPGAAFESLRDTGMGAIVAPGTRADSAAVIDRLPARLPLRLTAWLRETRADSLLGRLRFGRAPIVAVRRRASAGVPFASTGGTETAALHGLHTWRVQTSDAVLDEDYYLKAIAACEAERERRVSSLCD